MKLFALGVIMFTGPGNPEKEIYRLPPTGSPPIPSKLEKAASLKTPAAIICARVEQTLQEGQAAAERADVQGPIIDPHPTAVSPWLELTRWPEYLRGQSLAAAALLDLPA
ncbi:hypothetical protein IFM47457_07011 [Aspergillus lentulus]|nr:hypothetical protein IFM47457_07011 [Aspergillus lentulus]